MNENLFNVKIIVLNSAS